MIKKLHEPQLEFSRPLEVARVPNLGSHEKLSADPKECAALAIRMKVPTIYSVSAQLKAKPWRGGGLKISGEVKIDLEQVSVISLQNFRTEQVIDVERYFLNLPPHAEDDGEMDLDPIVGGIVDLGEVVAETIALELDPYPRMPGESFSDKIESEPEVVEKAVNPFSVLKGKIDNA